MCVIWYNYFITLDNNFYSFFYSSKMCYMRCQLWFISLAATVSVHEQIYLFFNIMWNVFSLYNVGQMW